MKLEEYKSGEYVSILRKNRKIRNINLIEQKI